MHPGVSFLGIDPAARVSCGAHARNGFGQHRVREILLRKQSLVVTKQLLVHRIHVACRRPESEEVKELIERYHPFFAQRFHLPDEVLFDVLLVRQLQTARKCSVLDKKALC